MHKIRLAGDTISGEDIRSLIGWLETGPRLTKGEVTEEFESKFAAYQGRRHAVYVNSGSSANLAMVYALMASGRMRNKRMLLPAVSWTTTVTPAIHLGLEPILCECDELTLGLDLDHLEESIKRHDPSVVMLVHVLGFPNRMREILELCRENDVVLLEDSCESLGSTYGGVKTGSFGLMGSFSFYYGHHISTIEGGMVTTDDEDMYSLLKCIRSHGWSRDLDEGRRRRLMLDHGVDEFKNLYTFYQPGFNLRSTDLQAFIGIGQLGRAEEVAKKRNENYKAYDELIRNDYWKVSEMEDCFVSNFGYPVIHPEVRGIARALDKGGVECRPLVCGSIGNQPYWISLYGRSSFRFADLVDQCGMYLPNHTGMGESEVEYISNIVNGEI